MDVTTQQKVRTPAATVGPPLLVLGLAFASILASVALLGVDRTRAHVVGYVVGSVVPLLLLGFFRRVDLDRRRNPRYLISRVVRPALVLIAVAALVLAALHVWPIATDMAS